MTAAPVVLDGEIVAMRGGRPDFGALQTRMHVRKPPQRLVDAVPICYYVFDLLHHGDRSLDQPYTARREQLAASLVRRHLPARRAATAFRQRRACPRPSRPTHPLNQHARTHSPR
jgi:ATP-dependent DNA ligase